MKENIELLTKYISDRLGMEIDMASLSVILALILLLLPLLKFLVKFFFLKYQTRTLSTDLEPFIYPNEVEMAVKGYVRTKFQNVNPGNFSDLQDNQAYTVSKELIRHFLRTAFNYNKSKTRYFIILADAGMGKTTFMINLYYHYKKRIEWFNLKKKNDIKLFPLGDDGAIDAILKIKNAQNTILLLDAFDEFDMKNQHGDEKMAFLLSKVSRFKQVVITCRTHYFKTTEEEPEKTGIFKTGPNPEEWIFGKFYISPFSDEDVKNYISKHISFLNVFKRMKAKKLLLNYHDLKFRPMLISHLPALLNVPYYQVYTYLVYKYLVESWIIREVKKSKNKPNHKEELYKFSYEISKYFIKNKTIHIHFDLILKIANDNNIILDELDLTSRSLLNRNTEAMFKFSHKSIFEYFAACLLFENKISEDEIDFEVNDLITLFYKEMYTNKVVKPVLENLKLRHHKSCDEQTKIKMEAYLGCSCFDPIGSRNQSALWIFDYFSFINAPSVSPQLLKDYPRLKQYFESVRNKQVRQN